MLADNQETVPCPLNGRWAPGGLVTLKAPSVRVRNNSFPAGEIKGSFSKAAVNPDQGGETSRLLSRDAEASRAGHKGGGSHHGGSTDLTVNI